MILPEFQSHVDEVGSNTNVEKDKVLKEKELCHCNNCPHKVTSSSDHHYTTLGFINGRGQPVYCCIIIAGKSIGTLDILGIYVIEFGEYFIKGTYKDDDELPQLLYNSIQGDDKIFKG